MLETELGELLRTVGLEARQRRAVTRRLGWDGRPPGTLKEAGNLCSYTRERVRQLEERVVERVERARPQLPVTAAAVEVLRRAAPASRAAAASLLVEHGLSGQPFDAAGVLRAARLAGISTDVVAHRQAVVARDDLVLIPVVGTIARKLAVRAGAATPRAVAELAGLREPRVHHLLELGGETSWLAATGWFTVTPLSGPIARALRKLLAARPDLRARELRAALGVDLPLDVVEALLALAPRDGALSETERAVVDALRREGGAATVRRLAGFVEPAGITRTTAAVCLSRSPLFRRLERGRWALAV